MLLFVTRKFPPSVGGMQQWAYRLASELGRHRSLKLIAWGGPAGGVLLFLPLALVQSIAVALLHPDLRIGLFGDAALAPLAWLWRTATRRRAAVVAHGLDVIYPAPLYRLLVPAALRRVDLVIVVSESTRALCLARGVAPDRCLVIPNGVAPRDARAPAPAPAPRRRGKGRRAGPVSAVAAPRGDRERLETLVRRPIAGRRIVLTVGRMVRRKGVSWFVDDVLPELARAEPALLYVVAGPPGPDRPAALRAAAARGLAQHCAFVGTVGESDLGVLYRAAEVFVMPNVPVPGDAEGFGIVAAEASAAGVPVVASDLEGIPEAVRDGVSGVLVPPRDGPAFVRAIRDLLADDAARRRLGEGGRRLARGEFSWTNVGARYLAALEKGAWPDIAASPS